MITVNVCAHDRVVVLVGETLMSQTRQCELIQHKCPQEVISTWNTTPTARSPHNQPLASKQGRYDYEALHYRASLALEDTSSSYRIQLFDSIVSHPKILDFCSLYAIYQNNDLQASLLIRNN